MMPNLQSLNQPIILASASPRRRDLLCVLGATFQVLPADVDERAQPGERPDVLVARLAREKALAIAARAGAARAGAASSAVLAADTMVVLDGVILGKPVDAAEAVAMLEALRGRAHQVITGMALAVDGQIAWSSVVETSVLMRTYSDGEIAAYVASGRPFDKAGAYGIQDAEFHPVTAIDGCYANVVGLPLCEVVRALATVAQTDGISAAVLDGRVTPGCAGDSSSPCTAARSVFGG